MLGADVELMGKVGDDEFGRIVLERLGRYGAAEGMILSKDSSTSYSIVISSGDRQDLSAQSRGQ